MKYVFQFAMLATWVSGFVIAKGFWSTLACLFAPWAWYLVAEAVLKANGII